MKILTSLAAIFLALAVSAPVLAEEGHDPLNTLDALNHAIVSIYRVEKIPSKVTVDEEYNTIINNIAWGNITADPELLNLFTEMMNAYTENKLDDKDRAMVRKQYEAQVNRAFLEVKPLSHLMTETGVNAAQQLSGGSLWGSLLSAGTSALGGTVMALQTHERMKMQAQGQEQEYMQQRMAGEWELDKARIRRFNTLKTSLLNAVWPLLNRYNLPDEARLTENNLDQFYSFISEKNVAKALRMGKRLETNFAKYPPFWFYLGVFYLQNGEIKEARACFDKFEEVNRPILRKDSFAAANARYKLFTLNETEKDEAKRLLEIIEKQVVNDDWNTVLFAALQNYQLGNKKKAEDLLYQNIDNGFDVPLNTEILHQIQTGKIDLSRVQGVAIREFKEPSELEKLAKAGNPEAQYAYGRLLENSGTTSQSYPWMEQAAKQGHFFANCWLIANSEEKKEAEAKKLLSELTKKAEAGDAEAQAYLGFYYGNGIGTSQDVQKAFYWFQKAAEQGDAIAQNSLAYCYASGIGTVQDVKKAFFWHRKSAEQGYPLAQFDLALCYDKGIGTTADAQKAFFWCLKAAEQGDAVAQHILGLCYQDGHGTAQDAQKAFFWIQKAAEQGYPAALNDLGLSYGHGIGVAADAQKAFFWHQKAAETGDANGQTYLGLCFENGIGTNPDAQKAVFWYQKAAEQGDPRAQFFLANCYRDGIGTAQDAQKASFWYQKAVEQGHTGAKKALENL